MNVSTQPLVAVNVAFSQSGLNALNVNDNIGASELSGGMYSQNFILGDTNSSWLPQLTGTTIHGVFMIVSDTTARVNQQMTALQNTLGSSIVTRHTLLGESRASPNEGKESAYLECMRWKLCCSPVRCSVRIPRRDQPTLSGRNMHSKPWPDGQQARSDHLRNGRR